MSEPINQSTGSRTSQPDEDHAMRIVELLGGLPADQRIEWHDPLAFDNEMFLGGVDVWAPLVCHPMKIGWAWSIAGEATGDDGPLTIVVSPDTVANGQPAWNGSTISRALERWTVEHAQRPDLRFAVDTSLISPMAVALEEAAKEEDEGIPLEDFLAESAEDEQAIDKSVER